MCRIRRAGLFGFVLLVLSTAVSVRAEEFFFRNGDRVVMMGDSITEQHLYSNYVEMWTVTRFPGWDITFRNVGIGGDRSTGGNSRFQRDAVRYKATAMTVDFGMNDGGYKPFDEPTFKTYAEGLKGIADQARAAGIRMAWVTPQPLDTGDPGPTALTGYNQTLERFSDGVKSTAEKYHGLFVDQFHPYLAALDKARRAAASNGAYERITEGDAVHPGPPGQALMAYGILKGLGFPPLVSSVEITLVSPSPGELKRNTRNCEISTPTWQGDTLTFDRTDAALPFFPNEARSILKWAPILDELNQYTLKIVGLKEDRYTIRLGGKAVAEVTSDALARGVNLADEALSAGPVAEQVKAVKAAIEAKNRYHHDRIYRGVTLSQANVPDWLGIKISAAEIDARRKAAFEERMERMPELDAAIRKALEMRPYTVEVDRVGD
jgi:lysophospholipase L1-like esterase